MGFRKALGGALGPQAAVHQGASLGEGQGAGLLVLDGVPPPLHPREGRLRDVVRWGETQETTVWRMGIKPSGKKEIRNIGVPDSER